MEREWPPPEYSNVTQRLDRLCLRSGVAHETLRKLSKGEGNPDFDALHKVAVALKSDLAAMFSGNVEQRDAVRQEGDPDGAADELQRRRR
jgi:transcriptional regulator with XRE-family HTH domain